MLSDNVFMQGPSAGAGGGTPEPGPSGTRRVTRTWCGLRAEYAWLQPFRGAAVTTPHRIEVVFSAHDDVRVAQHGRTYDVHVHPGGMFVVGAEPTTLLRVGTHSDTLEMYPDRDLLRDVAGERGVEAFELQPTLQGERAVTFYRDPVALGAAHLLRRACLNRLTLSDVEAASLAHALASRIVTLQHGGLAHRRAARQLGPRTIARLGEFIEANLAARLTLGALAHVAQLSPYHFARCFKATTGLAPHQYVMARRIELTKRLVMHSDEPIQSIAWSAGFENLSHFRRTFAAHIGVVPGVLRQATRGSRRAAVRG